MDNRKIFRRAWSDARLLLGFGHIVRPAIVVLASAIFGFGFYGWIAGFDAVIDEAVTFGVFTLAGPGLVVLSAFLWSLARAPERIIYDAIQERAAVRQNKPPQTVD